MDQEKEKKTAEFYKQRLINYLRENYLLFSEYFNPGSGLDVIFPELKAYTSPIYLGGADNNKRSWLNQSISSGASASLPLQVSYYTATAALTTFTVNDLVGNITISAFRSGLNKIITGNPTSDTAYLTINNGVVTLPTGDVTLAGELFTFLYR